MGRIIANLSKQNKVAVIVAVLLLLLFTTFYFETLEIIQSYWFSSEYERYDHAVLVLLIFVYILYKERAGILRSVEKPDYRFLAVLFVLTTVWLFANLSSIQLIQIGVLPIILLAALASLFGKAFLKKLLLPFGILYSALPIWQPISPLLQDITTRVSHTIIKLIGKPVYVEGNTLHLPGGSFIVEDGCSGLGFLLVTISLVLISSSMYKLKTKQILIVGSIGVFLALFSNWVRVVVVILIGDYTKMQHSLVHDHHDLGWVIYLVLTLIPFYFLLNKFFNNVDVASDTTSAWSYNYRSIQSISTMFMLIVVAMIMGPAINTLVNSNYIFRNSVVDIQTTENNWQVNTEISTGNDNWAPEYTGYSQFLEREFIEKATEQHLQMYIIHYENQKQGRELINVNNMLVNNEEWMLEDSSYSQNVNNEVIKGIQFETTIIKNKQIRKRISYTYFVNGINTTNKTKAKLLQLLNIFKRRNDGTLVVFAEDCINACSFDASVTKKFLNQNFSLIENLYVLNN